jgi:hypothetical protein
VKCRHVTNCTGAVATYIGNKSRLIVLLTKATTCLVVVPNHSLGSFGDTPRNPRAHNCHAQRDANPPRHDTTRHDTTQHDTTRRDATRRDAIPGSGTPPPPSSRSVTAPSATKCFPTTRFTSLQFLWLFSDAGTMYNTQRRRGK